MGRSLGRENRRIVRDEISVETIPDGEFRQQLTDRCHLLRKWSTRLHEAVMRATTGWHHDLIHTVRDTTVTLPMTRLGRSPDCVSNDVPLP